MAHGNGQQEGSEALIPVHASCSFRDLLVPGVAKIPAAGSVLRRGDQARDACFYPFVVDGFR